MQSESTAFPTQPQVTIHTDVDETTQHGFNSPGLPPANSVGERPNPLDEPSSFQELGASERADDTVARLGRLSVIEQGLSPKPSVRRITEYENASLSVTPRPESGGPAFKIIKRKGNRQGGCQIDSFPNEVLTHIFSHLPAESLSAVSLVCRRFYGLVTTPHAWRIAFSRYFPGKDSIDILSRSNYNSSDQEAREDLRVEQRIFTRLTALASWRSEYILRTRLLRSLERGKPSQIGPGHGASSRANSAANNSNPVVTYNSQLFATINHIHAIWGNGKKPTRFIHGTDETGSACTSDPNIGKVDNWGLTDPQSLPQFADLFPGDAPYGLGEGLLIGVPNVMDVSQHFGMVYGEGFPGGLAYFRSSEEMRGRFLAASAPVSEHVRGIPGIPSRSEALCSVWIAKSPIIPTMTDGLVGIMTGSSCGVVTTYSLGADNLRDNRLSKGEVTAKWMLSPGVPIIALAIDESYNLKRKAARRVWAVALNALGELFYLTQSPVRASVVRGTQLTETLLTELAWETGRSVYWDFVEPSRRVARDDPYNQNEYDGSCSPRSSCKSMDLSPEQVAAETREVEVFVAFRPAYFRKICEGWGMRRKLEVDFAGDDEHGAGEGLVVIGCGLEDGEVARVMRYVRVKVPQASRDEYPTPRISLKAPQTVTVASLFGGGDVVPKLASASSRNRSVTPEIGTNTELLFAEEWRSTIFFLPSPEAAEITASAIDISTYALLTTSEDPLLTVGGDVARTAFSTPSSIPVERSSGLPSSIPGHRGRFISVGTKTGLIVLWDMRGPQSPNSVFVNELQPLRIIQTDSPQIACLALSALYMVHGGNDGLVQTWDPLGSTLQPVRTLNSRFSSRARRRLVQAEASAQGVGINLYAAGAIAIDPEPTVLRGMVSLGTHLRYWSFSSTAADRLSSKKRRLRRSGERGSNSGPDRYTNTGRGALMDYIATEQEELKKEKERRAREEARLRGRFGVALGGMNEDEVLRYAEIISQETFQQDEERRTSDSGYFGDDSSTQSLWSSETVTPEGSVAGQGSSPKFRTDDELDHDIEEAIRLSLLDGIDDGGRSPRASGSGNYDVPVTYKQKKSRRSASSSPSTSQVAKDRAGEVIAADDLEYALQLSLAEEQRRKGSEVKDYPSLYGSGHSKGKRRAS
ncbi:MAG: hypothetical protein M1818_001148 [Claussenomyces sp. TS43310]|nr:MAG: hypothetical protein M1818_001148 [Claussenomyces sp. TS43310]